MPLPPPRCMKAVIEELKSDISSPNTSRALAPSRSASRFALQCPVRVLRGPTAYPRPHSFDRRVGHASGARTRPAIFRLNCRTSSSRGSAGDESLQTWPSDERKDRYPLLIKPDCPLTRNPRYSLPPSRLRRWSSHTTIQQLAPDDIGIAF